MNRGYRAARHAHPETDYGLLVAAATVTSKRSARFVSLLLRGDGVRATWGPAPVPTSWGGRFLVLVFPEDARRAYRMLSEVVEQVTTVDV